MFQQRLIIDFTGKLREAAQEREGMFAAERIANNTLPQSEAAGIETIERRRVIEVLKSIIRT